MDVLGEILEGDSKAIAIVGARKATPRGRELAFNFSYILAESGFTIVSGLARGIDTAAHKGAISAGGRTIAVLGSGIDIIYPPENFQLSQTIAKNGALVTEFEKGTKPLPGNFLQRNRLIAKLSKAVLVIEGLRRSGTLSTASWAGDLNREVFAIPGSEATDWLISQGATIATSPLDIIEYLDNKK